MTPTERRRRARMLSIRDALRRRIGGQPLIYETRDGARAAGYPLPRVWRWRDGKLVGVRVMWRHP